jgi:hypothetical protein
MEMSPRRTNAASYCLPFRTRYFVLYFGWTLERFGMTTPFRGECRALEGVMHQRRRRLQTVRVTLSADESVVPDEPEQYELDERADTEAGGAERLDAFEVADAV